MSQFTPYTFTDVQKQDQFEPIYVINTSRKGVNNKRERIAISIPRPGNLGVDLIVVPTIDMPINLTEQVARESLMSSPEFRRACAAKMLTPINPEEAAKFYQNPRNQRALDKLIEMENLNMMGATDEVLAQDGNQTVASGGKQGVIENPMASANNATSLAEVGINPTVYAIMESAGEGTPEDLEDRELQVELSLRGIDAEDKGIKEYEYILRRARDFGFKEIERKVVNKLKKLRATTDEDDV